MIVQLGALLGIVALVYREKKLRERQREKANRMVLRSTEHAAVRLKPRPTGDVTPAPIRPPVDDEFLFGGVVLHLHPKVIPFPTNRDDAA